MAPDLLLGVDIGTYETKAVAVDPSGTIVARARRAHAVLLPQPGWAEHDPEEVWWRGLCDVVTQLLAAPGVSADRVAGLGICAIGPCVLPVDRNGQPLRDAILYGIDTRATEQIGALVAASGADTIFQKTHNSLSSQSAGPKILWIREREPEIYRQADRFVTSQTYVVGKLTGQWVIDHATAGYFDPLYDPRRHRWADDGDDIVSQTRLPSLAWSSEIAGELTPEAATTLGLRKATPVVVGTADAPAEALASGCYASSNIMVMYGSSIFMIAVADTPHADHRIWSAPFLFEGTHVVAAGMATAGTLTRWFVDLVSPDGARPADAHLFQALASEAAATPPGADGLMVLPYFSGERTPINDPHARGVFFGLTLKHGRGHLYRAMLEAIAQGIRANLKVFAELGVIPSVIRATGGGTNNEVWAQSVSDVSGHRQEVVPSDGAAVGAAFLAALGTGLVPNRAAIETWIEVTRSIEPNPSLKPLYDTQANASRRLYELTRSEMHEISKAQGAQT